MILSQHVKQEENDLSNVHYNNEKFQTDYVEINFIKINSTLNKWQERVKPPDKKK